MDPATLAMVNAGSTVLGKALGPSSAGPSNAFQQAGPWEFEFDGSGWNVNFGSGDISSKASKTESDPLGLSGAAAGLSMDWQTMALVGLGVVAIWMIAKR